MLQPRGASLSFDVRCSMFDVRCSFALLPAARSGGGVARGESLPCLEGPSSALNGRGRPFSIRAAPRFRRYGEGTPRPFSHQDACARPSGVRVIWRWPGEGILGRGKHTCVEHPSFVLNGRGRPFPLWAAPRFRRYGEGTPPSLQSAGRVCTTFRRPRHLALARGGHSWPGETYPHGAPVLRTEWTRASIPHKGCPADHAGPSIKLRLF